MEFYLRDVQPETNPVEATEVDEAIILADLDEPRLVVETGPAARIAHLAEPVLKDLGYRLVRVKVSAANGTTVQIMAERADGQMNVRDCELASTALSAVFDVEDVISQAWHLEMSSPGIDRPLVRVSDFKRAIGHEAKFETGILIHGRKRWRGWIERVEGDDRDAVLFFRRTDSLPEEPADVNIPLKELAEGRLILTEALIRESLRAAKAALKASGEEDTITDEADKADQSAPVEASRPAPGRFAARQPKPMPLRPAGHKSTKQRAPGAGRPKS